VALKQQLAPLRPGKVVPIRELAANWRSTWQITRMLRRASIRFNPRSLLRRASPRIAF
jgi:hypothetical protein